MYNEIEMGALRGCRAVKFDSCKNLLLSVHTMLVIILRYVRLNIKTKILFFIRRHHDRLLLHLPLSFSSFYSSSVFLSSASSPSSASASSISTCSYTTPIRINGKRDIIFCASYIHSWKARLR